MRIYLGKKGLKKSWQEPFPEMMKCNKCGKDAKIMFVGIEDGLSGDKEFICNLYKTTGEKGGLWLHDCCAVAVYLCQDCFEPNAIINQA